MAQSMDTTRHSRRNGAMRDKVRSRADDVLEDFNELSKDVSRLADAAAKAARAEVDTAGQRVRHFRQDIKGRAKDGMAYMNTTVREHPRAAVGITLGAGVLVGLLLARR
jgi:ElaB/YqjD/DUF883 family membrane-anchored ribosome-binding protein